MVSEVCVIKCMWKVRRMFFFREEKCEYSNCTNRYFHYPTTPSVHVLKTGVGEMDKFWLASNLPCSSYDNQVNTLIYCIGDKADGILRGISLHNDQIQEHISVKEAFDKYFVPKKMSFMGVQNLTEECSQE